MNYTRLLGLGGLLDLFRMRYMPDFVYEFFFSIFPRAMELREGEKEDRNDFVSIISKLRNEESSTNGNKIGKFYKTTFNFRGSLRVLILMDHTYDFLSPNNDLKLDKVLFNFIN